MTTQCDIACTYCFYTTGHEARDTNTLDVENVDLLVSRLVALNFDTVIVTGGDPLSTKDKDRTIALTSQLSSEGVRVIINTSGVFLNEDDCERLVDAKPARIDFSIDSCDKHTHNSLRGRFGDTVRAMSTLRSLGYRDVVTTTVVTARNRRQIVDTHEFLLGLGAAETRFQPAFLPEVNLELGLVMNDDVRLQLSKVASRRGASPHLPRYFRLWERYFGDLNLAPSDAERSCAMGKDTFVSDSLGNLTGCFHRPDVTIGNILTDELDDLGRQMTTNALTTDILPACAGPHCTSMFDDDCNWS